MSLNSMTKNQLANGIPNDVLRNFITKDKKKMNKLKDMGANLQRMPKAELAKFFNNDELRKINNNRKTSMSLGVTHDNFVNNDEFYGRIQALRK